MLNVNSRKSINRLSKNSLKYNQSRNIIATVAIILTAVLFTVLLTIGGSMLDSFQRATMRQVGTSAHGGFKFLTQEQYEKVKFDPKVKDISYNIIIGFGENPEFKKTYVEVRYTEEKAAEWSFNTPTTGTLPQSRLDIATTTKVLDALGLPHELGVKVPLEFTANGVKHKEIFTLCGFWEQDVILGANEAFLSREYSEEVAPVWQTTPSSTEDQSYLSGSINPSLWFSTSWNIEKQIEDLKERCGFDKDVNEGVNWAYASSEVDSTTIILIVGTLSLIMLSGYLIIYNIFYISVSKDIRFYGLLKTIGTTNRQLKHIVRRQAFILCVISIPIGLIIGYLCSSILAPIVIKTTTLSNDYIISSNPAIFIGGGIFTLLTVWISCIKPCRLVCKISPVEAVSYTEDVIRKHKKSKKTKRVTPLTMALENIKRTPKKTISVILSLSLSIILLNCTVTLVRGFDINKYLEHTIISDFYITDASLISQYSAAEILNGVSKETIDEINNLDGITEIGNVYMKESLHKLSDTGFKNSIKIVEEYKDTMPMPYAEEQLRMLNDEQSIASHIYGVDDFTASKVEITDGKLDIEKLKSGNYVVASAFTTDGKGQYYNIGDKVTIDFNNGNKKEYEVMAVGDITYALGPQHSHYLDVYFTMYSDEFIAQTGETGALKTVFNVEPSVYDKTEEWVKNYCENVNSDLDYKSRSTFIDEYESMKNTYLIVGEVLSFILALIGILNFINSIFTSVQARRQELAVLQSIGMTGEQLKEMLISEGICYMSITAIAVLSIGSLITYGMVMALANQIWIFTYHFVITPVLLCIPILALFAIIIPVFCYKNMCKNSIVERLRECE